MHLLRLQNVTKHLGTGKSRRAVLRGVSLTVNRGEIVSLAGPSGSGKTTLLLQALRLQQHESGIIEWNGSRVEHLSESQLRPLRRRMQIIFQNSSASLDRLLPIRRLLAEPLHIHRIPVREHDARMAEAFSLVGLQTELLSRYPGQLSGGQLQKVAIARALIVKPAFVACDEIVSSVDYSQRKRLLSLLQEICSSSGVSFLLSTHNLAEAGAISSRIYVLLAGRVIEHGPGADVAERPLHPFTDFLMLAARQPRLLADRPDRIDLSAGSSGNGCPFARNCPRVEKTCLEEDPPLRPVTGHREVACHFPLVDVSPDSDL